MGRTILPPPPPSKPTSPREPENPSDTPEDLRRMVEAMHWAKSYIQASGMEGVAVLSTATDWFARAMHAARQDERRDLAKAWSENDE